MFQDLYQRALPQRGARDIGKKYNRGKRKGGSGLIHKARLEVVRDIPHERSSDLTERAFQLSFHPYELDFRSHFYISELNGKQLVIYLKTRCEIVAFGFLKSIEHQGKAESPHTQL